jgi:hypothetical protein
MCTALNALSMSQRGDPDAIRAVIGHLWVAPAIRRLDNDYSFVAQAGHCIPHVANEVIACSQFGMPCTRILKS